MKSLLIIWLAIFCYTNSIAQTTSSHQLWLDFSLNTRGHYPKAAPIGKINHAPAFSAAIQYRGKWLKKLPLHFIGELRYRRQAHKSEYYFSPNRFTNRDDFPFSQWVSYDLEKDLNSLSVGLGIDYEFNSGKRIVPYIGFRTNVYYPLWDEYLSYRRNSSISLAVGSDSYVGVAEEGHYLFPRYELWFPVSATLHAGFIINNHQKHPLKISLGYTYGSPLGFVKYEAFDYLGNSIKNVDYTDRLNSIDLSLSVKF